MVFLGLLVACRITMPLDPVDLGEPGWSLRQGQALWHPAQGNSPELAGEILVAQGAGGRTFIQFSKPPFPIVSAQQTSRGWELRSPAEDRKWAGPGTPPSRIIWFQLPFALDGKAKAPWQCERENGATLLKNGGTGEWLRIVWTP